MPRRTKKPKLPQLLDRKIYKTGQTRGADDDVIYQNRVIRTSTVLIPYDRWEESPAPPPGETGFEKGFIVLLPPAMYFGMERPAAELATRGLELGRNALVFYQLRTDWERFPPGANRWRPATHRTNPLGGEYVARIAGTTAHQHGGRINEGFTTTNIKGAGIRLFEYASSTTTTLCRIQLEALYWLCDDSTECALKYGMTGEEVRGRKAACIDEATRLNLLDLAKMKSQRFGAGAKLTACAGS